MLNARILIAPLRFGAGVKGKFLDAMRCATPSITTWIGAEGITDHDNWTGAICSADTTNINAISKYVNAAVSLYQDEAAWTLASEKAVNCVNEFKKQERALPLAPHLLRTHAELTTHREPLFLQSLLWHQSLTASKYMSQWIEAKNKHSE